MKTTLTLVLQETKKHSGKYVIKGTESDPYPQMMYLRKDWFDSNILPPVATVTVEDASRTL